MTLDLTHFEAALRRLLPGRRNAYLRRSARGLALHAALTGHWGSARIVTQLQQWYGDRISDSVLRGLRVALALDIPGGQAMRVQVRDHDFTVLCEVDVSGKIDDEERAEENMVFAVQRVKTCFEALNQLDKYRDWDPQPRLLYAIRLLIEAQNEGARNDQQESVVFSHFVALHGMSELVSLLAVGQARVTQQHT